MAEQNVQKLRGFRARLMAQDEVLRSTMLALANYELSVPAVIPIKTVFDEIRSTFPELAPTFHYDGQPAAIRAQIADAVLLVDSEILKIERKPKEGRKPPEDVAQICRNGHVVLSSIQRFPELTKSYCEECGAATIERCQLCDWPIRGIGKDAWMGSGQPYRPPNYCGQCGEPFPWTEIALATAREYADDLDQLSVDDKKSLKGTFADLTSDTPRTPLAVGRFRKYLETVGPAAAMGLLQIIVSVATDEVKKQLGLR